MLNGKIQAMLKQASSNSFALMSVKMLCIINELMSKKNWYSIEKKKKKSILTYRDKFRYVSLRIK